jgi:hypothetical protein
MSTVTDKIQGKIEQLPPKLQIEALHYIDILLDQSKNVVKREMSFSWEGSLSHLKERYTSVELQHRILQWWH